MVARRGRASFEGDSFGAALNDSETKEAKCLAHRYVVRPPKSVQRKHPTATEGRSAQSTPANLR